MTNRKKRKYAEPPQTPRAYGFRAVFLELRSLVRGWPARYYILSPLPIPDGGAYCRRAIRIADVENYLHLARLRRRGGGNRPDFRSAIGIRRKFVVSNMGRPHFATGY